MTGYVGYKIFYPEQQVEDLNSILNAITAEIERNHMAAIYAISIIMKTLEFTPPFPPAPNGENQADFEATCKREMNENFALAQAYLSKNKHSKDFQRNVAEHLTITYNDIQKMEAPEFLSDENKERIENHIAKELGITLIQLRWHMHKTREWIRQRDKK